MRKPAAQPVVRRRRLLLVASLIGGVVLAMWVTLMNLEPTGLR